jgi:arylsulfatase A-like enzyme
LRPGPAFKLNQKLEGHRVALVDATYARLVVPLADDQLAWTTHLLVRVSSARPRAIDVTLNGRTLPNTKLVAGWQTLKIPIPAGTARAGENTIELMFGQNPSSNGNTLAIEWLQLGGTVADDAAPPPELVDPTSHALAVHAGTTLAYYLYVPNSAQVALTADVTPGCPVAVHARAHGVQVVDGALRDGAGSAVALGALAGKIARVELSTKSCDAHLATANLTIPGAPPSVPARPAKPPGHVIFWIMDSLRADKVRPFFPSARPEVPNWEKLAHEGTIFRNTYVQGNESRASHASIWTGVYPVNHRMIDERAILDSKWTTLGRAMKATGLFTSGVTANGYVDDRWGFGGGWDAFHNHIHREEATRGEDIWRSAQQSLTEHTAKPFFLYMGMVDTHVTWRAHEPWFSKYDGGGSYDGAYRREMNDDEEDAVIAGRGISERDKARVIAFYDSDVSYQDDLIGKVRDQLAAWGIGDDTLIVIMADHGDELWEDNGRLGHGGSLKDVLVHVPLVFYYPPFFPPGTVVDEGTEIVDVLPTLLDVMGKEPPPEVQGESLVPLAAGVGRGYARPSFSSMYEDSHAMRIGDWKIIMHSNGIPEVFDDRNDHYEHTDLAATRPIERRFLMDSLSIFATYQKDWKKRRWGVATNLRAAFAEDVER